MDAVHSHGHGAAAATRAFAVNAYRDHIVRNRLGEPFKNKPRVAQSERKACTQANHHVPDRACNIGEIGRYGNVDDITHGCAFALLRGSKTYTSKQYRLIPTGKKAKDETRLESPFRARFLSPNFPTIRMIPKTTPPVNSPRSFFHLKRLDNYNEG